MLRRRIYVSELTPAVAPFGGQAGGHRGVALAAVFLQTSGIHLLGGNRLLMMQIGEPGNDGGEAGGADTQAVIDVGAPTGGRKRFGIEQADGVKGNGKLSSLRDANCYDNYRLLHQNTNTLYRN